MGRYIGAGQCALTHTPRTLKKRTQTHHTKNTRRGEDAQDYTVGIRGVATVSKGHHKMLFSLVFTNAVWVEKVGALTALASALD